MKSEEFKKFKKDLKNNNQCKKAIYDYTKSKIYLTDKQLGLIIDLKQKFEEKGAC